jgi:uncharacterized membrane-anchored protein YitT (DUF2179 family)
MKLLSFISLLVLSSGTLAHDMTDIARDRMASGGFLEVLWTGAEHMLSGYDHLLFLLGVMFFLSRFMDILKFVTAFTIGHTITLIFATYAGITANHYLIDAVIAVTVAYKGFENLNGFERWLGIRAPSLLLMVFIFGLIHGFGLSARLQAVTLAEDPDLLGKILLFNMGVEIGQILALMIMAIAIRAWQQVNSWPRISQACNSALIAAGGVLLLVQLSGYVGEKSAQLPAVQFTVFADFEQMMGQVRLNGDPLRGATVQVQAVSAAAVAEATTDSEGWFSYTGIAGESYRLSVPDHPGSTEIALGTAADAHVHDDFHVPFYFVIAALLLLSSLMARYLSRQQTLTHL